MFKTARIKLTAWYLVIIMAISLSFSGVIYFGVNGELTRIEHLQSVRVQRNQMLAPLWDELRTERLQRGLPVPEYPDVLETENIQEVRLRIIAILGFINLSILLLSGAGGYFLAGRTLEPIAEMVDKQKEFVSDASHELRTPLTSLRTEIEVALRDKGPSLAGLRKLLQSNLEDVTRMQKLSNYLLELNRYETGAHLEFSDVDLSRVVEKAASNLKFKFDLDLKKSVVKGNEDSLVELATILLDNAVKYGKSRAIEVKVRPGGVFEVKDRGVGIPKEDLPHIFDRFYRSDKSRGTDGYGLGLSIAKSIVDLHGGKIEVESKVGKGTTFRVTI